MRTKAPDESNSLAHNTRKAELLIAQQLAVLCCFTGCKDLMQLEWENTIGNTVPLVVFAKHSLLQK